MEGDAQTLRLAAYTYTVLWPWMWRTGHVHSGEQHLSLCAALAATLALWCWLRAAPSSYRALRSWVLGAYQVASAAILTAGRLTFQLNSPPTAGVLGAASDALRVLIGCKCHVALFFGAGLPLDLLPQLAVQSLLVGLVIGLRSDCQTPMLDNQVMEGRLSVVTTILSATTLGLLPPPGAVGAGREQQCVATLNFLLFSVGWLPVIYLATRRTHATTAARAAAGAAAEAGAGEAEAEGQRQRPLSYSQRLAAWLMENVFLEGAPPGVTLMPWLCLVAFCWMAAQVMAAV